MNIDEINEKIINQESLTDDEVNYYLGTLNELVKEKYGLDNDIMKCQEISRFIYLDYAKHFDGDIFACEPFYNKDIGIDDLTHFSMFLKFKTTDGDKWYIFDPTTVQFKTSEYPLNGKKMDFESSLNERQIKLLNEFQSKGFVEVNASSLIDYTNIFVNALNNNGYNISKLETNKLLEEFCTNRNITFGNNPKSINSKTNSSKSNNNGKSK